MCLFGALGLADTWDPAAPGVLGSQDNYLVLRKIAFGPAIQGPKPYKFIGFGGIHGPKTYKFIGFGDIHGPKLYEFIAHTSPRIYPMLPGGGHQAQGLRNPYLRTPTLGFCRFYPFSLILLGFVGAMAWPWPSHGPNKSKKITKKIKNCKNPKIQTAKKLKTAKNC